MARYIGDIPAPKQEDTPQRRKSDQISLIAILKKLLRRNEK
jgi:hypothetical protein